MELLKRIIPFFLLIVGITCGIKTSFWIGEHYFFDKLFYYKSTSFGYWVPGKNISLKDFGRRSKDLMNLQSEMDTNVVLGASTDSTVYTIVVIGDSYVWGQGIREEDRFVNILEQKLNHIRPTKIISLATCGDSMLDNYIKYLFYTKNHHADLVIFGMVDNDTLLRMENQYSLEVQNSFISECGNRIVFDSMENGMTDIEYNNYLRQSYDDTYANICVFRKALNSIPKNNNILFFNFGNNLGASQFLDIYAQEVQSRGFSMVTIPDSNDGRRLHVSLKESHPSAYANRIFADVLYTRIVELMPQK